METAADQECIDNGFILPSSNKFGYLASYIFMEHQKGAARCPWVIQAVDGQVYNITLLDFTRDMASEGETNYHYDTCKIYATINELGDKTLHPICGNKPKQETWVYTSTTSTISIRMHEQREKFNADKPVYFLLKYQRKN